MSSKDSFFSVRANKVFNKDIYIPTSKSFANRAIVLAALTTDEVIINNIPESSDVVNMINALVSVGLDIEVVYNSIIVKNSFPECEILTNEVIKIHTGDGGTTNRFLIPLLALGCNKYEIVPSEKMLERPMDEMFEILKSLDVRVERSVDTWFTLKGPMLLTCPVVEVDCSVSTQFATGLALVLSVFNCEVEPRNLTTSRPYWEMTVSLIEKFKTDRIFDVPVDFSSLSYPLAYAALTGGVKVINCKGIDRFQADSFFITLLEKLDVELHFDKNGLLVKKNGNIKAFNVDCNDCPDLIPTLCFLASYAKGDSVITGVEVLKHKECDRLAEMLRMLSTFRVTAVHDEEKDCLYISGTNSIDQKIDYHPPVDHRMAMVAYLFQRYNGGGSLFNYHSVNKSFPNYFEVME